MKFQTNATVQILPVYEVAEATKIDQIAAVRCSIRVAIPAAKDFVGQQQSVQQGAFSCTIRTEQKRDGTQLDRDRITDALESLNCNGFYHPSLSFTVTVLCCQWFGCSR